MISFRSFSDRPIAIAYSPTEPNPSHLADVYRPTPAHPVHPVVHRNTVAEEVIETNSNANQQFQAPFIPSINLDFRLENTQQSTQNGWSIVTPASVPIGARVEPKINRISASLANANVTSISRSDSGETGTGSEEIASVESTTRKFDMYNFRPEFQSGFMPIYKNSIAPSPLPSLSSSESGAALANAPILPQKSETVKAQSNEKSMDRSDNFSLASLLYGDEDDNNDDNDDETDE